MKYSTVVLGVLMAALPLSTMAANASLLPPRVSKAIAQRIDAGQYPAIVVAVVDGKRSEVITFGTLANGSAPDADTVFEIGSVTKTFTATLLTQAVIEGDLQLDTPVATLLPGFNVPSRDGKAITPENLATQHSGLPRLPGNLRPADVHDPYADYDGAALKAFLASYTLTHTPGSAYEYSNLGVGLLGYTLAQHANMPYPALLQAKIFVPLGMGSSATTLTTAMRGHLARGHDEFGHVVGNWNFKALAGAGAIKSTAADMLRYLMANMGQANMEQLDSPLTVAMQLAQKPRADAGGERIGLVWMTRAGTDGTPDVIWHNGMTGGYASYIGFTADHHRGVVVLTNVQQSVDDIGLAALLQDTPLAPAQKVIHLAPSDLDAYVGGYQLAPGFILKVFRDGTQLYAQATGQGALPIFASARDEFFAKVVGIRISFQRDSESKVNALVLHQAGMDQRAPRVVP